MKTFDALKKISDAGLNSTAISILIGQEVAGGISASWVRHTLRSKKEPRTRNASINDAILKIAKRIK
jgi:hypothetical protein